MLDGKMKWSEDNGWVLTRTWCTERCKQLTLKDRKMLHLKEVLDKSTTTRDQLRYLIYEIFGSAIATALARQVVREQRLSQRDIRTQPTIHFSSPQ